jgi:hypothetical protein
MPKPKTGKSEHKVGGDEVAQAARERELRDLIDRVETEKSGNVPFPDESPNDFVERRMRDKSRK